MIKIKGDKKTGFILTVIGKRDNFKADIALTPDELEDIYKLLKKRYN